ncbi:virulence factor TspB C-terminal domain-related protein [Shewanella xiamenensis]|uniref:virulence factor TspB C-terminal domain-related protein n=1 Tax=Shewanella xiamenensis TaxID=332186 RepID=UPI00313B9598
MAFSPSRSHRLRTAYFLLAASISANVLAYTPPATPNLPLFYEFTGANAVSESTDFYNSQCDADNFSWYGVDWFCATGDPTNPVCQVKMAYHSTDVNACQDSSTPEFPDPNLTPDIVQNGSGDNQKLIEKLELMRISQFNKMVDDGIYQDTDLSLARQTNSLLSSLGRTLSYANDNRSIVDAINRWGATLQVNAQNVWQTEQEFWVNRHRLEDFNFDNRLGGISSQLTELSGLQSSMQQLVNNTAGGGSGGSTDLTATNRMLGNIEELFYDFRNYYGYLESFDSYMKGDRDSLLTEINNSINALGDDNSAVVEQLLDANSNLNDIVEAIGKGGDGSNPDAISENGCAAFSCSSDSPECYIARKEWENLCKTTSDELTTKNSLDAAQSNITDFINSPDSDIKNIEAGTVDIKQFTNHYNSSNGVNFGGSDTCPPPYTIDAKITTFTLDLTPFCDLATVIKFFLIAFASVASGLMIVKYH